MPVNFRIMLRRRSFWFAFLVRRHVIVLALLAVILSACGVENKDEIGKKLSNNVVISKSWNAEALFSCYERRRENHVISRLNNYFFVTYRNGMKSSGDSEFSHYAGASLDYSVYCVDRYLYVIFDEQRQIFYIETDFTIVPALGAYNHSQDEFDLLWDAGHTYWYSGSIYFPAADEITYQDYAGKKQMLMQLEKAVWYRYFYISEDKPAGSNPFFHETTRAKSVYILDFDQLDTLYSLLIITEDGYMYQATYEYHPLEKKYLFYEADKYGVLADAVTGKIILQENDARLDDYIAYYQYLQEHTIVCITSSGKSHVNES